MWNQGIHARSGVACADCHMPYQRVGALKSSDHHVQSPLLNVNRACQTCHRWSEDELLSRVHTIQERTFQVRNLAMDALVALIGDIKGARERGTSAARSSSSTSSRRRTRWASTRIRKRCACSRCRSTKPGAGRWPSRAARGTLRRRVRDRGL
jgi:nitrite reductase (cytochrome c-552)